jgi:peptide deformylase
MVGHEIDHIHGILYLDRLSDGSELIPVSEYRRTGKSWSY